MKRLLLTFMAVVTAMLSFATTETWEKVTTAPASWDGDYLIVYETDSVAFNGSLTTLDALSNTKPVTITDGMIETTDCDFYFTIATVEGGYSVNSASGYYIGQSSDSNGLKTSTSTVYVNSLTVDNGDIDVECKSAHLRFNSTTNNYRFRYYKSSSYASQQTIQLYKKVEANLIYFDNQYSNWTNVYAYAWNSVSSEKNAEWPGVQLSVNETTGLYEYEVTGDWDKVIFNSGDGNQQTGNCPLEIGRVYVSSDPLPEHVYLMGNVTVNTGNHWQPTFGLEMTKKETGVYVIDNAYVADASNGYGYFSFSTALGTWSDVEASTRYGAETLDSEIGIGDTQNVVKGSNSWKIAEGQYKLTLDILNNTLTVEEATAPVTYIENLAKAAETTGAFSITTNATAVAQQGINLWIKDDSGWMLVYGSTGQTYTNGDVIPAGYGGTYLEYKGLPELQNPTGFVAATNNTGAVKPTAVTAANFSEQPLNSYVELIGKVTLDEGKTRNYTLTDESGSAAIYTTSADINVTTGESVRVRGFVSIYVNGETTTYQITPVESEEYVVPTENTVYFNNTNSSWDKVYAYAWVDGSEPVDCNATWPGVELTDTDAEGQYVYTLDTKFDKIIFNDGENAATAEDAVEDGKVYSMPVVLSELYMIGNLPNVGWDPSNGTVKLTRNSEGKYYAANVTIQDNYGGYGWFCILDQLGENSDDWSVNTGHRYGPAVGDTEVIAGTAAEMLLSGNSWKAKSGTYNVTVDLSALTLLLETPVVDGIDSVNANGDMQNVEYYNVQGMKVEKPGKGLYIIHRDGKTFKQYIR
ncbi:MAG: starch-binding protein [Prevotella sp.]